MTLLRTKIIEVSYPGGKAVEKELGYTLIPHILVARSHVPEDLPPPQEVVIYDKQYAVIGQSWEIKPSAISVAEAAVQVLIVYAIPQQSAIIVSPEKPSLVGI